MDNNKNGWRGMTIHEIMQKVNFVHVKTDDKEKIGVHKNEKVKDKNTVVPTAYLGPRLWDTTFSISNEEDENEEEIDDPYSSVMDLKEFLAENNIKQNIIDDISSEPIVVPRYSSKDSRYSLPDSDQSSQHSLQSRNIKQQDRPSIIISPKGFPNVNEKKVILPKGENQFLYTESKRAKLEREKEERRRKIEFEIDVAPEDLALATIPGADFDPKERSFDLEELRPQPIIKKRKKLFVPDENKDGQYWERRQKNNSAARRSREARRLKENQIALRAAFLEKENSLLREELDDSLFETTKLETEVYILKKKLAQYESFAAH